jgi:hypothetical protein
MSEWGGRTHRLRGTVEDVTPEGKLRLRLTGRALEIAEGIVEGYDGAKPFAARYRGADGPVVVVKFAGSLSRWVRPSQYAPREEGLQSALVGAGLEVRFRVVPYSFTSSRGDARDAGRKIDGISFKLVGVREVSEE